MQNELQDIDITIVGSSLTAVLVAAQLSQNHKLSVALIIDTSVPFRTTSSNAFCFPLFLAPSLWHCLQAGREEILAISREIGGRKSVVTDDLSLACISSYGVETLDHLSQLANLFGIESELGPAKLLNGALSARTFRRISEISGPHVWQGLAKKFDTWKIPIFNMRSCEISHDGKAHEIKPSDQPKYLSQALVLIDDGVSHVASPDDLTSEFQFKPKTEIVYEDRRLASGPMFVPELSLNLSRGNGKTWNATIAGSRRDSIDGLSTFLGGFKPELILAMRRQNQLAHRSNFPYFGELDDQGTKAIVGFDNFGPFCAPMLARWILGEPSSDDQGFSAEAAEKHRTGILADLNYPNVFGLGAAK